MQQRHHAEDAQRAVERADVAHHVLVEGTVDGHPVASSTGEAGVKRSRRQQCPQPHKSRRQRKSQQDKPFKPSVHDNRTIRQLAIVTSTTETSRGSPRSPYACVGETVWMPPGLRPSREVIALPDISTSLTPCKPGVTDWSPVGSTLRR